MSQERSGSDRPILNPALRLMREPVPRPVTGRSPTEAQVRVERLHSQRVSLFTDVKEVLSAPPKIKAGLLHIRAEMFEDSLAPTYLPRGVFNQRTRTQIVAPIAQGYLIETGIGGLELLAEELQSGNSVDARVAISRIKNIHSQSGNLVFFGRSVESLWANSIEGENGKSFTVWLPPFASDGARVAVIQTLESLIEERYVFPVFNTVSIIRGPAQDVATLHISRHAEASSLANAAREYRNKRAVRLVLEIPTEEGLVHLAASGASFRIDPILPLRAQNVLTVPDPSRPVLDEDWQPIVAIVDGGMNARSYKAMEAWRAPSLVADVDAHSSHGNRVSALAIQAHAWNTHLSIPALVCRIGTVQAIAKVGHAQDSRARFVSYLREVVRANCSECKVWNMSFNEGTIAGDEAIVSELGHEVGLIAREFSILPVISIGNSHSTGHGRVCPPGDCEAALTVGGRLAQGTVPDAHCPTCVVGPGPEGMLKPDLSWFSTLRSIGGNAVTGSSFAAPLVASLAAHAFHALKNPTPDLVKALLINNSDQLGFDRKLGWGTPWQDAMPWSCAPGTVTLVWTSMLSKGQAYYWNDIPIPAEMIKDGRFHGRVGLTAILAPLVSGLGAANYFSSRLEVALQTPRVAGGKRNLLGTMKESVTAELSAREDLAKWHPVRRHTKDFTGRGTIVHQPWLSVYARVFVRDAYQFDEEEIERPQQVSFVLSLVAEDADSDIYSSMTAKLGQYVQSAVIEQEIEVGI